jgi:Zn-dependent protease
MERLWEWASWAAAVLVAIVVHEYAHARVASHFGDPTPRSSGRLTLNPLRHLDPVGLIMLLLVRIGWAKPVPINPGYFRDRRRGMLLVSLAGPLANFALAFLAVLLIKVLWAGNAIRSWSPLVLPLLLLREFNVVFGVFNLLPIPPLDGSRILRLYLRGDAARFYHRYEEYGKWVILGLALTGLLWGVLQPLADLALRVLDLATRFVPR